MKTCPNPSRETGPDTARTNRSAPDQRTVDDAARDASLVRRFLAGNESAFTEIVKRHRSRIRALAYRTLHDDGEAEEVAQDTFVRAHRSLRHFRGDCSLATWLYRIGLNLARNRYWFLFRRHHQSTLSLDRNLGENGAFTLADTLAHGSRSPVFETSVREFVALVAQSLDRLDDRHREILTMRMTLDLSYEEIAANLGLNVGTVKSRIARARESLREMLHEMASEFERDAPTADFFEVDRVLPNAAPAAT